MVPYSPNVRDGTRSFELPCAIYGEEWRWYRKHLRCILKCMSAANDVGKQIGVVEYPFYFGKAPSSFPSQFATTDSLEGLVNKLQPFGARAHMIRYLLPFCRHFVELSYYFCHASLAAELQHPY